MSEIKKTAIFGGVALVLALLALVSAPRRVVPDAFLDRGEAFFPDFSDPNVAKSLEVIEFDEESASARPFKVAFGDGVWAIPSHHGYPADGKDRLAKTAAGVIGIKKDDFRTGNVSDHEACGVLDPLDEGTTSLKGRGKRVTLRGESDQVLADFIVGKQPEGRTGFRFVRIPDQKRVYVARMDIDISTKFEDWIEKDLLDVERDKIDRVVLEDYSIDERTGFLNQRDQIELRNDDGDWKIDSTPTGRELDSSKVSGLLTAVDGLNVVGVRPKPAGLSASLRRMGQGMSISREDAVSLQAKGYYFTRDGQLVSNEGELQVQTSDGIRYTLRFGEIVYGSGEALTAGTESSDDAGSGPGENRYMFISAEFDPGVLKEPASPGDTGFQEKPESDWTDEDRANKAQHDTHEAWKKDVEEVQGRAADLEARFGGWYYVISAESFKKVRLSRADLLKEST